MFGGASIQLKNYQYENLLRLCDDEKSLRRNYDDLDIYLEEIMNLCY